MSYLPGVDQKVVKEDADGAPIFSYSRPRTSLPEKLDPSVHVLASEDMWIVTKNLDEWSTTVT